MYVTNLPGRITDAKAISVASEATVTVGSEGLATRLQTPSEVIIYDADNTRADGYHTSSGEIIEFSGIISVENAGENAVTVYTLTIDSI